MKHTSPVFRMIILWALSVTGMILHFNYHVSKIFYGINVVRPGTNGAVPLMAQVLKNVYYHLPMLFIVSLLYFNQQWYKLLMFVVSIVYTLSHCLHLWKEFQKPTLDIAQVPLLSLVLLFSLLLNKASWDYYTNKNNGSYV